MRKGANEKLLSLSTATTNINHVTKSIPVSTVTDFHMPQQPVVFFHDIYV